MLHSFNINEVLDLSQAISPQVHRILRERIVKNDLKPGAKLSEAEIAKKYAVSRQPVREAFIKLAEEGLVSIRPQRSTLVTQIDYPTVLQARFVREAVEADIVAALSAKEDASLISELRAQLRNQTKVAENSALDFINEDVRFHKTLAEAADKAIAWRFIDSLNSQMDRVRFLSLEQVPVGKLIEEHSRIVDQIEQQNSAAASAAMREHLNRILSDLPNIIRGHREFFGRVKEE